MTTLIRRFPVIVFAAVGIVLLAAGAAGATGDRTGKAAGLKLVDTYAIPGLEMEVGGICPHPTNDNLYFVAANFHPAYTGNQHPKLPLQYRGKLLTVDRYTGAVVRAFDLVGGDYGGLAYGDGYLFVSSLEPPEILKVDLSTGKIVSKIAVSGPIGGLEYDAANKHLIAQLYINHPHLAVIDPATGTTLRTLWSDESAMDLAFVSGDLLCTWASGYDKDAFGELRVLDPATGRVKHRIALSGGAHTSMKPLDRKIAGVDGFISLVSVDKRLGTVAIRKYAYDKAAFHW
jgi:hypothetical protein